MPRISADELLARLQKGKLVPALLLLGDEPYLRDLCRTQVVAKFVPEAARDWAVSRYSADCGETQAALDQAQTLPMLSPQQVVFLEDVDSIEQLGDKNRETVVKQIEGYLQDPAKFTLLVLEAKQLDQRMRLGKTLAENTLVVSCGLGDNVEQNEATAAGLARNMAREAGVELEAGAAEDLAEAVAADLQRLKTEIEKLATYAGDRRIIRRADVSALVISEKAATVWEMIDMLASHDAKQAMRFLDCLLRDGEEPVRMVGAIAWMYRKLIEATEVKGAANGWQAARALAMRPEQAEGALRAARQIGKPRLLAGLRTLERADSLLKGSGAEERTVLEFLVNQLTGQRTVVAAQAGAEFHRAAFCLRAEISERISV